MELQRHLSEFERAGVAVFAISYDQVEAQAAFAEEFGITFPLLADPDHAVIEAAGILNTLVKPEETEYYGMPYPGSYVLAPDGTIEEKSFFQHYRTRTAASSVLRDAFGIDFEVTTHPRADIEGDGVRVSAILGGEGLVFMGAASLYVDFELDEGLHIYGEPVPRGYVATAVEVKAAEGVIVGTPIYPSTRPLRLETIDETFNIFEGDLRVQVPLHNTLNEGESLALEVSVRYQTCSDHECFLPQTRVLHLDVPLSPLHRRQR